MKIFYDHAGKHVEQLTVFASPAGHLPASECPNDWFDFSGERPVPKQFQIVFCNGEAEVDAALGRYLVGHGLALRTRPVLAGAH